MPNSTIDNVMTITGINHLTLAVSNLNRSIGFYTGVLNCVLRARWETGAYLECGSLWLCLAKGAVTPRDDYTHIALGIESDQVDQWRKKLKDAGISEWQSNTSEGDSIYFFDPDGHRLELHVGDLVSRLAAIGKAPYNEMNIFD